MCQVLAIRRGHDSDPSVWIVPVDRSSPTPPVTLRRGPIANAGREGHEEHAVLPEKHTGLSRKSSRDQRIPYYMTPTYTVRTLLPASAAAVPASHEQCRALPIQFSVVHLPTPEIKLPEVTLVSK